MRVVVQGLPRGVQYCNRARRRGDAIRLLSMLATLRLAASEARNPAACRICAQRITVVAVGVAGGDQQRTEANHLGGAVLHRVRVTRVFNACANRSATPSWRSICASNNAPPSELTRPQLKAAVTLLPHSAEKWNLT
jgi:hypothetical protein